MLKGRLSVDLAGTITLVEFKAALIRFNYSDDELTELFRKVVSNVDEFPKSI